MVETARSSDHSLPRGEEPIRSSWELAQKNSAGRRMADV
jgi:hypothetical protein